VISDSQSDAEDDADAIVQRARHNADAVLDEARDKADEELAERLMGASGGDVDHERAIADDALGDERAAEDESLQREREEQRRVLRRLLPLERAKTDRHLFTERVRSDAALANRDDFLSIVSHDLRNLLSGIVVSTFMLAEGAADGDEVSRTRVAAEKIQRYAARMNRLIGDLNDVGSIDAGRLAIELMRDDLTAWVVEALDTFQAAAEEASITLEAEHLDSPCTADFDGGRMLQVLSNLIVNAIKFTPPGGIVRVRCETVGETIQVVVRDTGPGIPDDMLARIFERFSQVRMNDSRGLGLGLYISRGIIEAHGGTIWADSKLGEGTQFCFTLPAPTIPST
jgi:signal transduction histidine kinase